MSTDKAGEPAFSRIDFAIVARAVRDGNAVKAAAYNASARLEHDGKRYDFRHKRERVAGCVLLPDFAPESLRDDPGNLWRAVEASERRVDAQLCRQILISLPRECPPALRLDALRAVAEPWVEAGMGCQVDLHCPVASDGQEQAHGHLLLTLREVTAEGLARTKNRSWNAMFRDGDGRVMRAEIDRRLNNFFTASGLSLRVDNRSREAQGLPHDLPPEPQATCQDWQKWVREGALPENRPIRVEEVFQHRQRREIWKRATASADAWSVHADKLEADMEALKLQNAERLKEAMEAPARNIEKETVLPAQHKVARAEAAKKEETTMAQRPQKTRTRSDSWMRATSWDALSDRQREDARQAWERWITQTRRDRERYTLSSYAEYVMDARQREEAARVLDDQPEAATDAPATQAAPQTNGISPSSFSAAADSRRTHLEALLVDNT